MIKENSMDIATELLIDTWRPMHTLENSLSATNILEQMTTDTNTMVRYEIPVTGNTNVGISRNFR